MQASRETNEVLGRIACQIATMLPDNNDDALQVLDMAREVRLCLERFTRSDALSALSQTSAVILPIR